MPNRQMRLAAALSAGSVAIDDFAVASTTPEMERDATVKAARAFYEFWNTGDEALLKQALAENFTEHALPPTRPQGPDGPKSPPERRSAPPSPARRSDRGLAP